MVWTADATWMLLCQQKKLNELHINRIDKIETLEAKSNFTIVNNKIINIAIITCIAAFLYNRYKKTATTITGPPACPTIVQIEQYPAKQINEAQQMQQLHHNNC